MEDINQYMGSVNLSPIDIDISDFGRKFNPSRRDYDNPEREGIRETVLNVLRKVVDLCNQNFRRNADGFLARKRHGNNCLLWPGGKRVQDDRFALSYQFLVKKKYFKYVHQV